MKYLFYFYSCFNSTFFGGLLDEAIELKKNPSNDVLFVYCGGQNSMCLINRGGSKKLCKFCTFCTKKVLNQYGLKSRPLSEYKVFKTNEVPSFETAKELRNLVYRNVKVGLAFMSGYISATRNMNPLIDDSSRPYFESHIKQLIDSVDAFYNLIEIEKPNVIYNFNGRYEEVRILYDISQVLHIKAFMTEGTKKNGKWYKVHFEDHLPHDIKYWIQRRDYNWNNLKMDEKSKVELGKSFFYNRRNGIYAGDKVYIKDQKKDNIPYIDKSKINIAIMNSSEDEFAAIGAEWDRLKFFPTQNVGIEWLLNNSDLNVHYYLRIHPNLKNIPYKYHKELLNLESKYNNITVIPGNSTISTYSLLDNMNKIIVFGSTMGIESAFWKVPTISLGPSLYFYDNICYVPKDLEDLKRLIVADLKPLYNDSILRYGAMFMDNTPLIIPTHNIDIQDVKYELGILKWHSSPFINFFVNANVTSLFIAVFRKILGFSCFNKYKVPIKEV